jgi:hypothetical protein
MNVKDFIIRLAEKRTRKLKEWRSLAI